MLDVVEPKSTDTGPTAAARLREQYLFFALGVLTFLLSAAIFLTITYNEVFTDVRLHSRLAWHLTTQGKVISNFLYFLVVGLVAQLIEHRQRFDLGSYTLASYFVMCAAVTWKFAVSRNMATRLTFPDADRGAFQTAINPTTLMIAVFTLSFAFCLPVHKFYPGQFPPNVWHNGTTIFLMPFALLLFWKSYEFLETGREGLLPIILALIALNLLVKPSMFFAFAPVFPLFCLIRFGPTRPFFLASGVTLLGLFLLAGQYWATFLLEERNVYADPQLYPEITRGGPREIQIRPFYFWSHWSRSLPRSFLASFLFPLVFSLLYLRRIWNSRLLLYAWACLGVAIAIMVLFIETGGVETAGNLAWQVIVCNYVLFLVCMIEFFRIHRHQRSFGLRAKTVATAYGAHLLAGLLYLTWMIGVKGVAMGSQTTLLPFK